MALRRGGESAAEAAAKAVGNYTRLRFFSLDAGKQMIVRFLTDSPDWLYAKQHNAVPCKNPPAGQDRNNWPKALSTICRYDEGLDGQYSDCYVCDNDIIDQWGNKNRATVRCWALACVREQVVENGQIKGYRDALVEVPIKDAEGKPTDQTEKVRNIIIINMGMKNFFTGLQGIYGIYGTVCDRDYVIKRTGEGKDSNYAIMPLDKIEGCTPSNVEWWSRYTTAVEEQGYDLEKIIRDRASDDYYNRFIDPNKAAPDTGGNSGQQAQGQNQQASQPIAPVDSGEPDPDAVAAMRNRVRGIAGGNGQTAPPNAQPQSQPEPVGASAGPQNLD